MRFTTRAEARAAGAKLYYPHKGCAYGHTEGRYARDSKCVVCRRERNRPQRHPEDVTERQPDGRYAKVLDRLTERARQVAIGLGLANHHHILRYAASHETAELQVKALHSEAAKKAAKKARMVEQEATAASQAAAATAAPRDIQMIDQRRDAARAFWSWLIDECGVKAYPIVSRLRDMDIQVLLAEVERLRVEGVIGNPKPALH